MVKEADNCKAVASHDNFLGTPEAHPFLLSEPSFGKFRDAAFFPRPKMKLEAGPWWFPGLARAAPKIKFLTLN